MSAPEPSDETPARRPRRELVEVQIYEQATRLFGVRGHGADPGRRLDRGQAAFPSDSRRMVGALGADVSWVSVRGTHFGGAIAEGEPTGNQLAAEHITDWLGSRHELTPPES